MDNEEFKASDRRTEELRTENETLDQELSKAQKKRAIAEAEELYGSDWKKIAKQAAGGTIGFLKSLRVKGETMERLHGGGDGARMRSLTYPRTTRGDNPNR